MLDEKKIKFLEEYVENLKKMKHEDLLKALEKMPDDLFNELIIYLIFNK